MVKLKQPLLSSRATGTLGNAIQFGHWKGRSIVGRKRRPKQPRTAAQLATRIYMSWLCKQWSTLSIAETASWAAPAAATKIPAYNAFIRHNIDRFKHLPGDQYWVAEYPCYPSTAYPTTLATNAADFASPAILNGEGKFRIRYTLSPLNDNWLMAVHQISAPHPLAVYKNLIDVWTATAGGIQDRWVDPAPVGAYTIHIITISRTGKARNHYRSKTVTVT